MYTGNQCVHRCSSAALRPRRCTGCPAAAGPLPRCRTSRAAIVPASRAVLPPLGGHCSASLRPAAGPGVGWASAQGTVRPSLSATPPAVPRGPPRPRFARPARPGVALPPSAGASAPQSPAPARFAAKATPAATRLRPAVKQPQRQQQRQRQRQRLRPRQGASRLRPAPGQRLLPGIPHYAAPVKAATRRCAGPMKPATLTGAVGEKHTGQSAHQGVSSCRLIASSPLVRIAISARRWCTSAHSSRAAGTAAPASRGYSPSSAGVPGSPTGPRWGAAPPSGGVRSRVCVR